MNKTNHLFLSKCHLSHVEKKLVGPITKRIVGNSKKIAMFILLKYF